MVCQAPDGFPCRGVLRPLCGGVLVLRSSCEQSKLLASGCEVSCERLGIQLLDAVLSV